MFGGTDHQLGCSDWFWVKTWHAGLGQISSCTGIHDCVGAKEAIATVAMYDG